MKLLAITKYYQWPADLISVGGAQPVTPQTAAVSHRVRGEGVSRRATKMRLSRRNVSGTGRSRLTHNCSERSEGFVCVSSHQRGDFSLSFRHLTCLRFSAFRLGLHPLRLLVPEPIRRGRYRRGRKLHKGLGKLLIRGFVCRVPVSTPHIRTLFLQHNVVCYVLTLPAVSEGKQYVLLSAEDESGTMVVGHREIIMQPALGPLEIIESNFAEGRFVGLLPRQATSGMQ